MACWYTTAICAAVRQRATLHALNYTRGLFFPLITVLKRDTPPRLWHSTTANVNIRYNLQQAGNRASRHGGKEERSVTALGTLTSGRRAQPPLRLSENRRNGAPRPALPRCGFRHADKAAARTRVKRRSRRPATAKSRSRSPKAAATAATSATPLRLLPRHQLRGRG